MYQSKHYEFDQVYVVSDLHLGGPQKNRIFKQAERLANMIAMLAENSKDQQICLVLNGDIVDFLADDEAPTYFDLRGAIPKLQRIYEDQELNPIWVSLEEFLTMKNCHLALVLGNHDVELALPPVRAWLLDRLSQFNSDRRGRIFVAFDSCGFACKVGEASVLCAHGNEVDEWNLVDFPLLNKIQATMLRDQKPPEWNANGGTKMVIDLINEVKKSFPMVDLLKPEFEAALPIVLALEPNSIKTFKRILKALVPYGTKVKDELRKYFGFLSDQEFEAIQDEAIIQEHFLTELKLLAQSNPQASVADLLFESQQHLEGDPKTLFEESGEEFLGSSPLWASLNKENLLRNGLKAFLKNRHDFKLSQLDIADKRMIKQVGDGIDFLVTGHTHLHRAAQRPDGGYYYNSGTWIRLIQLTESMLEEDNFNHVYAALSKRTMAELDQATIPNGNGLQNLIIQRPNVVSIVLKPGGQTQGSLHEVQPDGNLGAPLTGSIFIR